MNRPRAITRGIPIFLCVWVLVVTGVTAQTHYTVPSQNSTFLSDLQYFLRNEAAARYADLLPPTLFSGGTHGTTAGKISPAFATTGYTSDGAYVVQASATVDYGARGAATNDFCWLALHSSTTGDVGTFLRQPGTHYVVDCTSLTSPGTPANGLLLARVTITSGNITAVDSRAPIRSTQGYVLDACALGSLNAAITAASTTVTTILIGCPLEVTSNVTAQPTSTLVFVATGRLLATSAATVTIAGGIEAGPFHQWVGTNITVVFTNNNPNVTLIHVGWWGADNSGTIPDSCALILAAMTAAPENGVVQLAGGIYGCTTPLVFPKALTLRGMHRRFSMLYWTGNTTDGVIHIPFSVNLATVERLGIELATTGVAAYGVHAEGARVQVQEMYITPEDSTANLFTECIRTSETPVTNEHLYRDLDLPYCPTAMRITNGTNVIISNALISSYGVGVKIGDVPSGESVGIIVIRDSLFSFLPFASVVNSTAVYVAKGIQVVVDGNQFDLEPDLGNYARALDVEFLDAGAAHLVSFVNNRVNGNGVIPEAIVVNGDQAQDVYIAGNSFKSIAGTPPYAVKRFSTGGEIVHYGPNQLYPAGSYMVNPQFPVLNVTNPDVGNGEVFKAADSSATTWIDFANASPGKRFSVRFSTANTTVGFDTSLHVASKIMGNNGMDWKPAVGDAMSCVYEGVDTTFFFCTPQPLVVPSTTFANLGNFLTANGRSIYCSDCTVASPCAGSGAGAVAKRINGANVCN